MSKKSDHLDVEETEILTAYEAGKTARVTKPKAIIARARAAASATIRKDARINIRLRIKDLRGLQRRALSEGIPYQTLAASILHKYVEGRLN